LASTLIMTHGLGLGLEVPWPWPWPRRPMALALNLLASNPSLHKTAVDLSNDAGTEKLKTVITDSQKQHVDTTCNVFHTAYYIAKNNRPFLDMLV